MNTPQGNHDQSENDAGTEEQKVRSEEEISDDELERVAGGWNERETPQQSSHQADWVW